MSFVPFVQSRHRASSSTDADQATPIHLAEMPIK
jgi:hypothetical protein